MVAAAISLTLGMTTEVLYYHIQDYFFIFPRSPGSFELKKTAVLYCTYYLTCFSLTLFI